MSEHDKIALISLFTGGLVTFHEAADILNLNDKAYTEAYRLWKQWM